MASARAVVAPVKQRLVPLMDRVLVKKIESETKMASGVLLPSTSVSHKQITTAKVVATGPGDLLDNGKVVPLSVKEGDTVLVREYDGTKVKLGEDEYVLFKDDDIIGVMNE